MTLMLFSTHRINDANVTLLPPRRGSASWSAASDSLPTPYNTGSTRSQLNCSSTLSPCALHVHQSVEQALVSNQNSRTLGLPARFHELRCLLEHSVIIPTRLDDGQVQLKRLCCISDFAIWEFGVYEVLQLEFLGKYRWAANGVQQWVGVIPRMAPHRRR